MALEKIIQKDKKIQYCKVLCNGDWIGQLNYLTEKGSLQLYNTYFRLGNKQIYDRNRI